MELFSYLLKVIPHIKCRQRAILSLHALPYVWETPAASHFSYCRRARSSSVM